MVISSLAVCGSRDEPEKPADVRNVTDPDKDLEQRNIGEFVRSSVLASSNEGCGRCEMADKTETVQREDLVNPADLGWLLDRETLVVILN
jgi:hypothetical protein